MTTAALHAAVIETNMSNIRIIMPSKVVLETMCNVV